MNNQTRLSRRNAFLITAGWAGFLSSLVVGGIGTSSLNPLPAPYFTIIYFIAVPAYAVVMGLVSAWYFARPQKTNVSDVPRVNPSA